jgi:DNA polymerase I
MEFDLHPTVTLRTGTFTALVAPEDLVLAGLNDNPVLRRFLFLFVSGNYSRLLSGINRSSVTIEIRRAFTAFQLLTILRESYHTIIFVEHDPGLYEGSGKEAIPQVAQALKGAGQNAAVVLYTPAPDPAFSLLADRADRFFSLSPPVFPALQRPRHGGPVRHPSGLPRDQTTLEGF